MEYNKLRICEILGVGVNEVFACVFPQFGEKEGGYRLLMVNHNGIIVSLTAVDDERKGRRYSQNSSAKRGISSNSLCYLINNADRIYRDPIFSSGEVRVLETVKKLFPSASYLKRAKRLSLYDSRGKYIVEINDELFPLLVKDCSVSIEEVPVNWVSSEMPKMSEVLYVGTNKPFRVVDPYDPFKFSSPDYMVDDCGVVYCLVKVGNRELKSIMEPNVLYNVISGRYSIEIKEE